MDIGSKLKSARVQAGLTQEQAAEALGVSRQTMSNWENEKTYPDIVSVVKMSDLYHVTLDHLLKGEPPASHYLNYLEESTNTVKSNHNITAVILIATYLGIWAFSLITFWFFISGSDAMAYSIIFLWILLPAATWIISLLIGKNDCFGRGKWPLALAFGILYMLAEYATFRTANMSAFAYMSNPPMNPPDWGMLANGTLISLFGLGAGSAVRWIQNRAKSKS